MIILMYSNRSCLDEPTSSGSCGCSTAAATALLEVESPCDGCGADSPTGPATEAASTADGASACGGASSSCRGRTRAMYNSPVPSSTQQSLISALTTPRQAKFQRPSGVCLDRSMCATQHTVPCKLPGATCIGKPRPSRTQTMAKSPPPSSARCTKIRYLGSKRCMEQPPAGSCTEDDKKSGSTRLSSAPPSPPASASPPAAPRPPASAPSPSALRSPSPSCGYASRMSAASTTFGLGSVTV
mmetsp:Transcript_98956/g.284319  ORF Transcript_98956/g.284319 Transcript_98956/m.284319 type:complete len:242 (-) Transcript_98956:277-1002(-)